MQLSIFVTPTLAISGYVIFISSVVGFLSVFLHFVLVTHLVSCHHSHCISIVFIKLASVRVPPVLSVVRSEPDHTRTRPRHLRNIVLEAA